MSRLIARCYYRHWRELSISPAYELTLLRWEIQMQKNLGRSILDLITGLTKSAAKVRSCLKVLTCNMSLLSLHDRFD